MMSQFEITQCKVSGKDYVRYERHLDLKEIGELGQAALSKSKVAIVGAGGLGSPVCGYLAAAGVGSLDIIDDDRISISNLQRQVFFRTSQVGQLKAECLAHSLAELNPEIQITAHVKRLDAANAHAALSECDVIVDGTDNFETRYLINQIAFDLKKTLIFGSVLGFDGHVSVFKPSHPNFPCYRCVFRHAPPRGVVPSCTESAVFGPMVGTIGCMMAGEAIKELLSLERSHPHLLVHNALTGFTQHIAIQKDSCCPTCSA